MTEAPSQTPWWGHFSLEQYTGGEWKVGPSTLWVYRSSHDWRVVYRPTSGTDVVDPMAQRSDVTVPLEEATMTEILESEDKAYTTHRFSVGRTQGTVAMRPALADRPVVSRPEHPLSVLPDESVTLYLSTPLWMRIELAESNRRLMEVPSHRMSDTWFGASTIEGTFCYATRTAGRLRLDRLPLRMHRAVTPLTVRNEAKEPLALERVQLPAPHLALYATSNDAIWTDAVTMTHRTGEEGATVHVKEGSPADVRSAERIQEPREESRGGLITSTFSAVGALFGG